MTLKLLSYNIRFGGRERESLIAEVIKAVAPDLVVFQEATDPRVIEGLSAKTGMAYWAAQRRHSIAYLSRLEIEHHQWHYPAGSKHSFLEIVPARHDLRVFGLHLTARFSKWSERRRAREIHALLQGIREHQHGFHVLLGDFNTLAPGELLDTQRMPGWIRALVWISGRDIQRETIQIMLDEHYLDGYRHLYPDDKGYTFPTWDPHLRLDYIFLPARHAQRLLSCQVVRRPETVTRASDHFPLLAHLDVA